MDGLALYPFYTHKGRSMINWLILMKVSLLGYFSIKPNWPTKFIVALRRKIFPLKCRLNRDFPSKNEKNTKELHQKSTALYSLKRYPVFF